MQRNNEIFTYFVKDLKQGVKRLGLEKYWKFDTLEQNYYLENKDALSIMCEDGMPTYLVTAEGRIKILEIEKIPAQETKQKYQEMFFSTFKCKELGEDGTLTVTRIPNLDIDLVDSPVKKVENEPLKIQIPLYSPNNFSNVKLAAIADKLKDLIWEDINNYQLNLASKELILSDAELDSLMSIILDSIKKFGLPPYAITGNWKVMCRELLVNYRMKIAYLNLPLAEATQLRKMIGDLIEHLENSPRDLENRYNFNYNNSWLGTSVIEVTDNGEIVYALSDNEEIKINKIGFTPKRKL